MAPEIVSIFVMRPVQKLYMIGRMQYSFYFFLHNNILHKLEVYCTKGKPDV